MLIEELYKIYTQYPSIATDSRNINPGDIFFALKGPSFNGNRFIQQALSAGAAYCIADEPSDIQSDRVILVNDCLATLQDLAKYHRMQFDIPFIAITGSNGKTTSKELIHAVLSSSFITYTTVGNLNNHIGIPLTILKVKMDAAFAVIEMGANHQKEIEAYCTYTLPTHGLITNCGKAHLEGFGGIEGVKKGKGELFDYLRKNDGTVFIYNDYPYLVEMSKGIVKRITYGTKDASYTGEISTDAVFLEVKMTGGTGLDLIKTQLVGGYNLPNVLAAVCIGKTFGIADEKIRSALENYIPSNSRSQLIEKNSNSIILDAYNANPSSMKLAIENFARMKGNKKILILGGMMELGNESVAEHQQIIELIQQYQWEAVVLVGKDYMNMPPHFVRVNNSLEAGQWFRANNITNAQVLIKGSRSMKMELVLD